MYERNAVVIDKFFAQMFGYDEKNNLKSNYKNYGNLILDLEEYQKIAKEEDIIMLEYEKSANEIRDTQKTQESLYKKCLKIQETRQGLFENLDESKEGLQKKFSKIEEEIEKNNTAIMTNSQKFIDIIGEFNMKSEDRTKCGRERRVAENEYQKKLSETTEVYNGINKEKIEETKQFLKQENTDEIKDEINNQIIKNGAKEKVKFNEIVIEKAINVCTDLEKKKLDILVYVYEKTGRILNEIKNDYVKVEKHRKYLNDAESKLQFLNTISEYMVLFLDNERMSVVSGEKEHKKLMDEACENLEKDLKQIENLYNLLLKEISSKATKKNYKDLYNVEYLQDLLEDEKSFEKSIKKINMIGTIIYPSYWRVEGMKKIYEVFKEIVSEKYERDLSEFEPLDIIYNEETTDELEDINYDDEDVEEDEETFYEDNEDEEDDDDEDEDILFGEYDNDEETDEDDDFDEDEEDDDEEEEEEDEEDKVIDEILGFYKEKDDSDLDGIDNDFDEDDDFDDIDFDWDDEEDEDKDDEENYTDDTEFEEEEEIQKPKRKNKKRK